MKILIAWRADFLGLSGGMERVVTNFANEMSARGHKVGLAYCHDSKEGSPFFPLSKEIQLMDMMKGPFKLSPPQKIKREWLRMKDKKKMYEQVDRWYLDFLCGPAEQVVSSFAPDIIVSVDPTTSVLLQYSEKIRKIPYVTMIHFPPSVALRENSKQEKEAVEKSFVVQVLTESAKKELESRFPKASVVLIPNGVPEVKNPVDLRKSKDTYHAIFAARLDKVQKRQHLLIEAFAPIARRFPDWRIEFFGGEAGGTSYTHKLKNLISKYHLENQVFLKGTATDMEEVYQNADLIAFPSAFEGFSMAQIEGMSHGLPIIAFENSPGVVDYVRSGEDGILVKPTVEAFSEGLAELMGNQEKRAQFGEMARVHMKPYELGTIMDQWEKLLMEAAGK